MLLVLGAGMFKYLFNKLFGRNEIAEVGAEMEVEAPIATASPKKRSRGYKAEVKEKYGFDLPSSALDKNMMGMEFEKEKELEKACACYEGCVRSGFNGNQPYDRLIVLYRKLDRPKDVLRVVKKAVAVFEKVARQGRSDGPAKLKKYEAQLEIIS